MKKVVDGLILGIGLLVGYSFAGLFSIAALGALTLVVQFVTGSVPTWVQIALLPVVGWSVAYIWRCLDIKYVKKKPTII
jgi:membrane protein implicated in regulation of membrane protease activity